MAVYTDITDEALDALLATYDVGEALVFKGIAEGVSNSNFLLETTGGRYILTIYETRVNFAELPFFLGLMRWLAEHGFPSATPVLDRAGRMLTTVAGKPAAIVGFMAGVSVRRPGAVHCRQLGEGLAWLHEAASGYPGKRVNDLGQACWAGMFQPLAAAAEALKPGLKAVIDDDLAALAAAWPKDLPSGVIHADLFPDNVFFRNGQFAAAIDFYFACNDLLAYDLAICLNAWCFEPDGGFNVTHAQAMIAGYQSRRPLSAAERAALPVLAWGAAMRFFLTRLKDWGATPEGALVKPHNPLEYERKLAVHRSAQAGGGLMLFGDERDPAREPGVTPQVVIYTDGACRGNPGPGGWGALLMTPGHEREICGGELATTNNRMELTAAIKALEALKRPCRVELHTDSQYLRTGVTEWLAGWKARGWRTADKKPVKNEDLWRRLDEARARHQVDWRWVKGHNGHELNERADQLARKGMLVTLGEA